MAKGISLNGKEMVKERVLEHQKGRKNNGKSEKISKYFPSPLEFPILCLTFGAKIKHCLMWF